MNPRFAVIGNPIDHSLSPLIHQYFAKQFELILTYEKIQTDAHAFSTTVADFFAAGGCGLNITSPFKAQAFNIAKIHTPRCQQAKAANTLWMKEGILHADTTDGEGFIRDLSRSFSLPQTHVLILGAGGAARSIIGPLLANKITSLTLTNRTLERAQAFQTDFPQIQCKPLTHLQAHYDLVINTISANIQGGDFSPPSEWINSSTYCYDLVYHTQHPTPFVQWARQHGMPATDGLGMLVEQAAESFFIWHGVKPETTQVLHQLRAQ